MTACSLQYYSRNCHSSYGWSAPGWALEATWAWDWNQGESCDGYRCLSDEYKILTSTETIATFLSKYHPIMQLLLAHFSGVCGGTVTNSPDERKQISKRSRNCFICQKKFTSARTAIPQIDVDITLASAPRALPEVRRLTAVTRRSPYPTTCPEFSDHTTTAICAFNYCDAYQRWLYCSKQPGLMSTARRVPSPWRRSE